MNYKERALTLVDELKDRGAITNREVGTLRRAILLDEQTEVKGDLISREALKNLPFERLIHTDFGDTAIPIEEIDNAPTIEEITNEDIQLAIKEGFANGYSMAKAKFKRPQGEWIEHYDCSDGFAWLTCSRCMCKAYEDDYNFCPNCGADMRVKDELKEGENE